MMPLVSLHCCSFGLLVNLRLQATDRFTSSKKPHAFEIKLRNDKGEVILATDTAQETARWITAISNADYSRMYDRTRDAVLFLQNVSRAVAPFAAKKAGIPCPLPEELGSIPDADSNMVPPDAVVAQITNAAVAVSNPSSPNGGPAAGAAGSGAAAIDPRAALATLEQYVGFRASLTGTDCIRIIGEMRTALKALEDSAAGAGTTTARTATAATTSGAEGGAASGTEASVATASAHSGEEPVATAAGSPSSVTAPETLSALQASLAAITAERDQLTAKLATEKTNVTRLAAELSAAASVEAAAKSEVEVLKRTVEKLETENASLNKQITILKADLAAATAGGAAAGAAATAGTIALEGEVRRLKERVRELEGQLSAASSAASASAQTKQMSPSSSFNTAAAGSSKVGGKGSNNTSPDGAGAPSSKAAPGSPISGPSGIAALLGGGSASPANTTATSAATASAASVIPPAAVGGIEAEKQYESEWLPFLTDAQRLEREGNLGDSQQLYSAVLERKIERCGANSVPVAASQRDLGRVLALQQKFEAAEEAYSRSVEICSNLLGEGHPNTACALTDLAAVLREQSKFSDAEKAARRAVQSLKLAVGPNDASTATALYNLAGLAKRLNDVKSAEESYSEALRIFTVALGEGAGETADTLYQVSEKKHRVRLSPLALCHALPLLLQFSQSFSCFLQMGCLYRKACDYPKAGHFFSRAATSYSLAYGQGDKRVSESTKRARAMAEKITEGGGGSTSGRTGETKGEKSGSSSRALQNANNEGKEGDGSKDPSALLGGQSTFMSPSVGVSERLASAGGSSSSSGAAAAARTGSTRARK
jgi:tetratricopeptide (TPR) repeat protein